MKGSKGLRPERADTNTIDKPDGKSPSQGCNRRDFLRLSAAASLGLATGSVGWPKTVRAAVSETSRVVVVTDQNVTSGSTIVWDVVRAMIDAGLNALKDTASPQDAWLSLFPDLTEDYLMGIKLNAANPLLPSHLEVSYPLAQSLADTPVGPGNYNINNILAWDRTDVELQAAGHAINTSTSGVKCFGTDHTGIGFYNTTIPVNGTNQWVSRCYTDYSDGLINLSCLKHHWIPGTTTALKNHYGTISYGYMMHDNNCDPWIPALNRALIDAFGSREKLFVCDGIFGLINGGPLGEPQIEPKCIVLSEDPVALEVVCRDILTEYGFTQINLTHYIETAASEPYNLGNANPEDIERIDVIDPSLVVEKGAENTQPVGAVLEKNYPEPFNAHTTIPVRLDRPAEVRLTVFDAAGRKVRTLYRGMLSAGRTDFDWDGLFTNGRPAVSGRYVVRLQAGGQLHSRAMTLLR
jgi:hypothetical protein